MIKINRIIPQRVCLFNPDNKLMGLVNEFEFNDIRIQIKENKISGYYITYKKEKLFITDKGQLNN